MFDNAPIGYQSLDKNGCILDVNKAWLDSLGYQRDEVIGIWFGEFLHHDQKDIFQKLFPVNIQSREPIYGVEFTLKRKDGSFIIAEYTARIGRDAEGRFVRTHCVLQDITERKQAEDALRKSEERYRMLFEKSPSSLWDEDFSDVKIYIEGLRDSGIKDMRGYFENHPEAVLRCAALVKVIGVNKATLELYHAGSLEEFQTGLGTILGEEPHDVFREELIALADGETRFESEAITRTMKGDKNHIILRWSVLPGYEETLSKVLVSVMDITDRKQAEEELRESEEKYRNVYNLLRLMCDNVPDLIWSKDLEGRFLFVNQAMCDNLIMCDRPDKALGKTDMFFAEQQRNAGHEHTFGEKCIDSDAIIKEKRAPGRFLEDGLVSNKYLVLDVHKAPFLNKDGEMIGMVGCGRDVTKEKETEKALWKSEERYRSLVESSDDSIYLVAEDLTYLFMNRSHLSHYGGKTKKVIGRNYAEFHSENETRDFANRVRTIFDTGRPLSYEYQSERNGGYYLRSLNPVKDSSGETKAVTVVSRNITERKRVEDALRKSQKMLARTESIAHIGSWEWEIATDTVTWSEELFRIFQLDPDDGAPSWAEHPKLHHPKDFEILQQAVEAAVTNGTPYDMELRAFRKDGETRVCHASGFTERGSNGKPVRLFGSLHDITERKQAEEALRESHDRLDGVLASLNDAILMVDPVTRLIIGHNDATMKIFGYSHEDLINKDSAFLHVDQAHYEQFGREALAAYADPGYYVKEFEMRRKDGCVFPTEHFARPVREPDGRVQYVVSVVRDITERNRMEEELLRAQKLESLGLLAGGIAHDFNNILTTIIGNVSLAKNQVTPEDEIFDFTSVRLRSE